MKEFSQSEIEAKMNCPGYFEGVKKVSEVFNFPSPDTLLQNWKFVKTYLINYDIESLVLNDDGVSVEKINPFKTEEDIDIAKFLMVNFFA